MDNNYMIPFNDGYKSQEIKNSSIRMIFDLPYNTKFYKNSTTKNPIKGTQGNKVKRTQGNKVKKTLGLPKT